MSKRLLLFAGPNGSGKSTLYRKLQSKYASLANLPLVNPDDIAKELFGNFLPDGTPESSRQMLVAGKEALRQRKNLIGRNESFAFETTLSGNSEANGGLVNVVGAQRCCQGTTPYEWPATDGSGCRDESR